MDSMRNNDNPPAPEAPDGQLLVKRRNATPYETGRTYHMPRVDGGGGHDNHYWTVVDAGTVVETQWSDDTRQGERSAWAHVRPATDDEAQTVAQEIATETQRREMRRLLNSNSHIIEFDCTEPANSQPISEWETSLGRRERWVESNGSTYRVTESTGTGTSMCLRSSLSVETVRGALDA